VDAVWLLMLARALAFARRLGQCIRLSALAGLIASIALPAPVAAESDASEERTDPKVEPRRRAPEAAAHAAAAPAIERARTNARDRRHAAVARSSEIKQRPTSRVHSSSGR